MLYPRLEFPDLFQGRLVEHEIVPFQRCLNPLGRKIRTRPWPPPSSCGNAVDDLRTRRPVSPPIPVHAEDAIREAITCLRVRRWSSSNKRMTSNLSATLCAPARKSNVSPVGRNTRDSLPRVPPIRGMIPCRLQRLRNRLVEDVRLQLRSQRTADGERLEQGQPANQGTPSSRRKIPRTSPSGRISIPSNSLTRCRADSANCASIASSQRVDACSLNVTKSDSARSVIPSYLTTSFRLTQNPLLSKLVAGAAVIFTVSLLCRRGETYGQEQMAAQRANRLSANMHEPT